MRHIRRSLATAAAIMLFTTACATGSARSASPDNESGERESVTLRVTNNNWSHAVVWAVYGGNRWRLGDVPSLRQASLDVPHSVLTGRGTVQVLISLIGSREFFATDEVNVYPGEVIDLRVENQLPTSFWSVYEP